MSDWTTQLNQMVDELRVRGAITVTAVERAFRTVPRHVFLPETDAHRAYTHGAIPTKTRDGIPISSSSDPAVMAIMMEQLALRPGASVLEIGAGTGYNAAILAEMVGPVGSVTTMDLDEDISSNARANLSRAGYSNVQVQSNDGAFGVPERAPFDRIILTVGVYEISRHWVDQLKPGGIILAPLWIRGAQCLVAFEKIGASLESRSVRWGGFMRMRGALAGPESYITLPSGWMISAESPVEIDSDLIERLLGKSFDAREDLADRIGPSVVTFALFVASADDRVLVLSRNDNRGRMGDYAVGLFDANSESLCIAQSLVDEAGERDKSVRSFGATRMLGAMVYHLDEWASLGQPAIELLQVQATPLVELARPGDPRDLKRGAYTMSFSWATKQT